MTIPAIGGITSALSTMSTSALSSLNSAAGAASSGGAVGAGAVSPPTGPLGPAAAGQSAGSDFASVLSRGIDAVQSAQSTADNLAVKAATGDLTNIHDYTIAATQASLMTELATAIRTKGVDAFNQIMGMQA